MLAEITSAYTTSGITEHLVTNADVVTEFLPVDIDVVSDKGSPGRVTITPPTARPDGWCVPARKCLSFTPPSMEPAARP